MSVNSRTARALKKVFHRWSCQRRGVDESGEPEAFYEDRCCQDIFQNFLATITSRTNTITGTAYRCQVQIPVLLAGTLVVLGTGQHLTAGDGIRGTAMLPCLVALRLADMKPVLQSILSTKSHAGTSPPSWHGSS